MSKLQDRNRTALTPLLLKTTNRLQISSWRPSLERDTIWYLRNTWLISPRVKQEEIIFTLLNNTNCCYCASFVLPRTQSEDHLTTSREFRLHLKESRSCSFPLLSAQGLSGPAILRATHIYRRRSVMTWFTMALTGLNKLATASFFVQAVILAARAAPTFPGWLCCCLPGTKSPSALCVTVALHGSTWERKANWPRFVKVHKNYFYIRRACYYFPFYFLYLTYSMTLRNQKKIKITSVGRCTARLYYPHDVS